ncbi:hypothetical protein GUITHDRAFT_135002 [Guillardia theta CCMP2712]|uniref:Methyltransferase domain-containing protein n=2 Tax=Guillardia theta TaxID=55529 RepID=L1JRV6_GUITC|nr:hypothetical protein GUITHDRAFT_135002 [Guillardia theta CCMP2712]EKX50920.1 hypothetical protein GUITHDRAFT_135002 [Guillardia theta CCMP2712]|eukprot:XP_005837900.1 hypothetical protein GUITHDRAFT_135002 [Guillardia theta CCMP2712]
MRSMKALLLFFLRALALHRTVCWSFDAEHEADLHLWARRHAFPDKVTTLKQEVLLIGDGQQMRFWPLWGFYQYLSRASSSFTPSVRLITSSTPGFRFGMMWEEMVYTLSRSRHPVLYFLVSPGDRPLPVIGLRHYPGIKILDVEDMEGQRRLEDLIVGNKIDFVTFRYFNDELVHLQALCKETTFHHMPFFLNPSHFYRGAGSGGEWMRNRDIDVLVYGNTWSHRYPLRHRALRALTTIKHGMSFEVIAHPGYHLDRRKADVHQLLCSDIGPEFWNLSRVDARDLRCCKGSRCMPDDCARVSWRVMQGPLSSCDDVKTCPLPAAVEAMNALKTCLPVIRGKQLGDKLRRAKIVITCSIQGSTDHGFHVSHSYLVAKYHEIGLCGAVIAGDIPLSGHGSGLQGRMIHLDPEMSDQEIVLALSEAVSDSREMVRLANSSFEYFQWNTYARGTIYWTSMIQSMLSRNFTSPSLLGSGLAETERLGLKDGKEYSRLRFNERWQHVIPSDPTYFPNEECLRAFFEEIIIKRSKSGVAKKSKLVDVGAGMGTESLIAAMHGWDVIAIEALKDNVAVLQEGARSNNVEDRICVLHAAAYDCTGREKLYKSSVELQDMGQTSACQMHNLHLPPSSFTSAAFTSSRDSLQGFLLNRSTKVANEDDMRRWSRGADGTFRLCGDESSTICSSLSPLSLQAAETIATELVKVVCLDNFLNVEEAVDVMLIQDFQENDKVVVGSAKLLSSGLVHLVIFDNRRRERRNFIHEMLMMDFCVVSLIDVSDKCDVVELDVCLDLQGDLKTEQHDWIVFKHVAAPLQGEATRSPAGAVFTISETKLQAFAKLQTSMFDPLNRQVDRKFLVLRSGHGIANTMLEEVSALLLSLASGRALVVSYDSDIFGLQRPSDCFNRPFPMSLEEIQSLQEVAGLSGRAEELSGDTARGYARYHELAACGNFNVSLKGPWAALQHLYSFPALFLNPSVTGLLHLEEEEEEMDVFQRLHAFLHRPAQSILREAERLWQTSLGSAACSVGVQFRWHHLSEHHGGRSNKTHLLLVSRMFLEAAVASCQRYFSSPSRPLNERSIAIWIASDYSFVYDVFRDSARSISQNSITVHHLDKDDTRIHGRPDDVGDLSGDHDDHEASLLDLEMLSSCRFLVCTRLSTFGYVAYARRSNVNGRSHSQYMLCDAEGRGCREVVGRMAGLVAGEPLHQDWPWTEQKLKQVSCYNKSEGVFTFLKRSIFKAV